jgi:hypothetical protein
MGQCTLDAPQARRLQIKTIHQQMENLAVSGAGLSPWEARELVNIIDEVYFQDPALRQLLPGQMKYSCLQSDEPAGKPLKDCQMKTVVLTLFDQEDEQHLPYHEKDASITRRWRRLMRISEEARVQSGLLTQEDLAQLLMCDVRTIRRDISELKKSSIVIPTRGTVNDIGPGVTHKGIAIRLWLDGKEPTEVALAIHHSLKATENYLEKFKRVVYLRRNKGFTEFEISRTIGISIPATRTFLEIYEQYKNRGMFKMRMDDIELIGKNYALAVDEKKDLPQSKDFMKNR